MFWYLYSSKNPTEFVCEKAGMENGLLEDFLFEAFGLARSLRLEIMRLFAEQPLREAFLVCSKLAV